MKLCRDSSIFNFLFLSKFFCCIFLLSFCQDVLGYQNRVADLQMKTRMILFVFFLKRGGEYDICLYAMATGLYTRTG